MKDIQFSYAKAVSAEAVAAYEQPLQYSCLETPMDGRAW